MKKWKYSGIPGMDLHDSLRYAVKYIQPEAYLEIGVDGGGSLRTVLTACQALRYVPGRIVLCDLWTGHAGHTFNDFGHIAPILRDFGARADFVAGDSARTVPGIPGPFDLILVDGGHEYEQAIADLNNSWPLLRTGGLLVLDDVGHVVYPGVGQAFREFMAAHPDAELIEEEGAAYRNSCILTKR